jgi:hypothetical protein
MTLKVLLALNLHIKNFHWIAKKQEKHNNLLKKYNNNNKNIEKK